MFLTWKMDRPVVAGQKFERTTNGFGRESVTATRGLTPIVRFAGLATMTTMMAGCGAGLLGEGLTGLSSTAVALDAGQTYTFDARLVGAPSVTWSLAGDGCVGTSCGQLSSTTGGSVQYTAPANVTKQQSVTLSAKLSGSTSEGTTATIALNPHLAVSGTTLPATVIGKTYSATLQTQGGVAPYRWSVASGSLPAGLALNPGTGEISGAPLSSGLFSFAAKVSDASAADASAQAGFTLRVDGGANAPLALISNALPNAAVGAAYNSDLAIAGGTAPYRCTVAGGALPAGLRMNGCTVSGTAATAGNASVTVKVTDAASPGGQVMGPLSLGVVAPPLTIVTTTLPSATSGLSYSASIAATGGVAPYSCAMTSGALPSGLSLSGCSIYGRMTGGSGSSFTIRVSDTGSPAKTADGRFSISLAAQPLVLLSRALANGTQGVSYRTNVAVLGGVGPYHCTVSGGALPSGLALDGCSIAGVPTTAGSGSVTIQVTDSQSPAAAITGDLSWVVSPSGLSVTTKALPNGTVGLPYSGSIGAVGGTPPYTCSVANQLPSGLSMTGCSLRGTPAVAAVVPVSVRLTDSGTPAGSVSANYVFTIAPAGMAIATTALPEATVKAPYSAGVLATGGTAPYTCSIAGGTLPAGLTLSGCTVAGTPAAAGSGSVSVRVADAGSPATTVTGAVSWTVAPTALTLSTKSLPNGTVGGPYSAAITATGGTAPYTCSVAGGALPAGVTMNGCTIAGASMKSGSGSVTVQLTDAGSPAGLASGTLSWTISNAALALTTSSLPNATEGAKYSSALAITGGSGPYTCTVSGGALPEGFAINACTVSGKAKKAGSGSVSVKVADASVPAESVTGSVDWTVDSPTLVLSSTSLHNGEVGGGYEASIPLKGGTPPYVCSVVGGVLPQGLSLQGCSVKGTPKAAGSQSFAIQASDAGLPAQAVSGELSMLVTPAALRITTTKLAEAKVKASYKSTIAVTGGVAPYTCSLTGGALPAGLAMNGCGISGTPAAAGTSTLTVSVADGNSPASTATGSVTVSVAPAALAMVTTALPNGTVASPYSGAIAAIGGTAPYTCTVSGGAFPAGVVLNGCAVTGTPTSAGSGAVTITVADASSPVMSVNGGMGWTIAPAPIASLKLATTALPNGTASVFYSSTVAATGGTAPYTCSLTSGTMPAGLSLAGCSVTGTPTAAANAVLTIQVTDAGSPAQSVSGPVNLAIAPAVLTLANASMPPAVAGQAYTGSMTATGGTAPYTYAVASGSLPAGVVLGADGSISGVPTNLGTSTFSAKVTDAGSPQMSATHAFSIAVAAPALKLTSATLPSATVGQAYTASLNVTGGTAPYTCGLVSGALPPGLNLSGCAISGTSTAAGNVALTIKATDASTPAQVTSATVALTVNATPLQIVTTKLPGATAGLAYSAPLSVSGGVGAVSCAISTGTLPAGLKLNPQTCLISGTPASAGTASFTVSASDANTPVPNTASATLSLAVNGAAMTMSTTQLPSPVLGQAYTQPLQVTGGQAPYTFSVTAGSLPRGLTLSAGGVISGTPTVVGASSFTVSVSDGEATPQTATQTYVPLVVYPAGPNDAQLSGPFAFLVQSYDPAANGDLPYQAAAVGSFTADGAGLVQDGEMDSNHQGSGDAAAVQPTHFVGTYQVGADQRGLLTITTLNGDGSTGASSTYAIAAAVEIAADGSESAAGIAAAGGEPMQTNAAPGMLLSQDKSSFAQALRGSYAFGLKGDTPCLETCVTGIVGGPVAEVGQFTTDGAGSIVNGTADSVMATTNNAQTALTGSYGATDANGRLSLTLNTANTPAGIYPTSYAVYVVDANQSLLMSSDNHGTHVLLSGTAELQTQSSFSNASMSGATLGSVNATVDPVSLGVPLGTVASAATATVFRTTATADGSCNVTNVDLAGAAQLTTAVKAAGNNGVGITALLAAQQATGSVSCVVAGTGRGVLTMPAPSATISGALSATGLTAMAESSRVFYLVAPGRGYFLNTGYAALGSFEPQAGAPFSNASLDGTYRFGTGAPSSAATAPISGQLTANAAGSATLTVDTGLSSTGQIQKGSSQTAAYVVTDDAVGRITMNSAVLYALSPDRFLRLDLDSGVTSPTVGSVQR